MYKEQSLVPVSICRSPFNVSLFAVVAVAEPEGEWQAVGGGVYVELIKDVCLLEL